MVEYVVDFQAQLNFHAFCDRGVLLDGEVGIPITRPSQVTSANVAQCADGIVGEGGRVEPVVILAVEYRSSRIKNSGHGY